MNRNRIRALLASLIAIPVLAFSAHCQTCPLGGTAKGPKIKAANMLKNRTAIPKPSDLDTAFTLGNVLVLGNDTARWRQSRSGVWVGWVFKVKDGGLETVNCGRKPLDTHIELVATLKDTLPSQRLIAEITPRMRAWAKKQGWDWSTAALKKTLTHHEVSFAGWAFEDFEHIVSAENTNPGHKANWRASVWELHPITAIRVMK